MGSIVSPGALLTLLIYKHKRGCTNDPKSLGSKFQKGGSIFSIDRPSFDAFDICTSIRGGTLTKKIRALSWEFVCQIPKRRILSFHQAPFWCFWYMYKHKKGSTNEKNACTILRVWAQNSKKGYSVFSSGSFLMLLIYV